MCWSLLWHNKSMLCPSLSDCPLVNSVMNRQNCVVKRCRQEIPSAIASLQYRALYLVISASSAHGTRRWLTGQFRMMGDWCYLVTAPQFAHELSDFSICSSYFTTELPPFCSLAAFTGRLSGNSKGYTDLEKYKAEAQNLGMLVSIWLNWLAIKTCKQ